VGEWLTASEGATVSAPVELSVDGRTALRYTVTLGPGCYHEGGPPADNLIVWFQAGETHSVYAIPTPDDVIVMLTWGTGYTVEVGEEHLSDLDAAVDDLVRSMHFD